MFTGEKREQGEEGHEFLEMEKWGACGISERMSFKKLLSWISWQIVSQAGGPKSAKVLPQV